MSLFEALKRISEIKSEVRKMRYRERHLHEESIRQFYDAFYNDKIELLAKVQIELLDNWLPFWYYIVIGGVYGKRTVQC